MKKIAALLLTTTISSVLSAQILDDVIILEDFDDFADSTANPAAGTGNGLPFTNVGGNPSGTETGLRNSWTGGTVNGGGLDWASSTNNSTTAFVYRFMTVDPYGAYRFDGNNFGATGTSLYGAVDLQLSNTTGTSAWFMVNGTGADTLQIGFNGSAWALREQNTGQTDATSIAATTATTTMVWRWDFADGEDTVSLWVNPSNIASLGDADATLTGNYQFFSFGADTRGGSDLRIDNLQVGTSLVPEPSAYAMLAGLIAFSWGAMRRRR